jgi:hypothetical protein
MPTWTPVSLEKYIQVHSQSGSGWLNASAGGNKVKHRRAALLEAILDTAHVLGYSHRSHPCRLNAKEQP